MAARAGLGAVIGEERESITQQLVLRRPPGAMRGEGGAAVRKSGLRSARPSASQKLAEMSNLGKNQYKGFSPSVY